MKRTRGSSLYYHYGVSEYCGWVASESTKKSRKSIPHCIFCDALIRKMERKAGDEKEKEKVEGISDLVGQEQKVETRSRVVEVEVEEVPMENLLEELKLGGDGNGNAAVEGGGENFEGGFRDFLKAEDLKEILNGWDLAGWGNWHFEDDMIWREWEADWVYGYSYSHQWVTVNNGASCYSWDPEIVHEAFLNQDWEESLWVLGDDDSQN